MCGSLNYFLFCLWVEEFMKVNPMKFVPALVDGDAVIGDSYAIALYLEDKYPEHPLLPQDLKMKALNLQIASIVCSGIQPLHNLTVLVRTDLHSISYCHVRFSAWYLITQCTCVPCLSGCIVQRCIFVPQINSILNSLCFCSKINIVQLN
jgi:hypothetical protein